MNIFKNLSPRVLFILKIIGFSLLAVLVLAVMLTFLRSSGFNYNSGGFSGGMAVSPTYDMGVTEGEMGRDSFAPSIPQVGQSVSLDAEEFEITDYRAVVETRNLESACGAISSLKPLSQVIFENVTESDKNCQYTFKVENTYVPEVLAVINELNPKNLSENTRTIKRQLDDFTSQREILEQRIEAIEETLTSALTAYAEVTTLASRTDNAESLARIITSRIEIIERLTNERLKLSGQMENLLRNQAEALERIDYAQFSVNITENKYFDGEVLADSWRDALRKFFRDANSSLQGLTIGLTSFVFALLPFILYGLVFIFALKYIIRLVRHIWRS